MPKIKQNKGKIFGSGNNGSPINLGEGRIVESIKNYDVLKGVELIGSPVPVSYREMARNPRNKKLHELDQLMDTSFYDDSFHEKTIQEASKSLGENAGLVEKVVSSPVNIEHVRDNIFVFLSDFANYEQVVQFLKENDNEHISIRGRKPFRYNKSEGLMLSEYVDVVEGLAQVAVFSQPVDFRNYFATPKDMGDFNGDYTVEKVAQRVFEEHFRTAVTEKAKEVEDLKKRKVKGILLSPIKAERRLADGIFIITTNPKGEFLLGASYLI